MVETTWQTRTGWLIVRDALCMGPWHNLDERSKTHRRSPTDFDAEHCLLRTVRCVSGSVDLSMTCDPVFDYGRVEPDWHYDGERLRRGHRPPASAETTRPAAHHRPAPRHRAPRARARTRMVEGDNVFVALSLVPLPAPMTFDEASGQMIAASEHWRQWITQGDFPDHRWRAYLQRSALTLKGLTYAPTGALLAAATTSLPETPHGERNWDYRYAWVRDSTFALWGLYTLGFDREADDFFDFIADAVGQRQRAPSTAGHVRRGRRTQPRRGAHCHLSGYDGASPVRIGNGAYNQEQHDVWGAVLDSVLLHARSRDAAPGVVVADPQEAGGERRSSTGRSPTAASGRCAASRSTSPPASSCAGWPWTGAPDWPHVREAQLRRAMAGPRRPDPRRHLQERRRLTAASSSSATESTPSTPRCCCCRCCGSCRPTTRGSAPRCWPSPTSSPRTGWCCATGSRRPTTACPGEEGTFTICSFWLVSALVEIGEVDRGRRLCERLLSYASPLRALRRGARPPHRPPSRQLPAGVHPSGADQRRHARDPRRGGIRRVRHVPACQCADVTVPASTQRADVAPVSSVRACPSWRARCRPRRS